MANRFCNLTGTNKIKDDFDNVNDGFDDVQQELDASDNRIDGHVAGTSEKHSTTHITNSSNISGSTTTEVLNNVKTRMDDHVAGTTEKHGSSAITNQSSQSGNTVTDAINSLAGVVQNITVTDSNANIGVYSLNASGTNTITTTFTNLTYFAGLKINLSIANDNTGAVTVNLNSIGAKNLYKVVKNVKTALSPRDIRQGEIACIQYDGTDFILLNGERDSEYSTTTVSTSDINSLPSTAQGLMDSFIVKGRTATNLLPDAVAGCESTSGWSTYNATVSLDSANEAEGTNCIKITRGVLNDIGGSFYDISSIILGTGKYYLVSGLFKTGNCTNIKLYTEATGDAGQIVATPTASNSLIRQGVIIQPSDYNSATNFYIGSVITGSSGQYGYEDALSLIEISSAEYALGVDALLAKYSFHLGTKSADKLRVKTININIFDGLLKIGYLDTNGVEQAGYHTLVDRYIKVKASTNYYANFYTTSAATYVMFYDINKSFISYSAYGSVGFIDFTTPANCVYIRTYTATTLTKDSKLMIHEGTTSKTYEVCQKKQSSCNIELKATSETITDTWNPLTGEVTESVEKYSFVSGDITGLTTSGTNVDWVVVSKSNMTGYKYISTVTSTIGSLKHERFSEVVDGGGSDNVNYKWKVNSGASAGNLLFIVPKGTYADLAAAKTALTGTQINYQLLTPITTWLQPNTLLASANGTVEQSNNFATDFYIYRNSVLIPMYVDLYMRTVDEVRKWDLRDGSYTLVPLSDVTVSGGAVSAIVGSQEGDFYSVDYYGSSYQSVNGELNFSYPINAMGQIDVTTKEVIKLESTVKNLNAQIQELLVRIVKLENP